MPGGFSPAHDGHVQGASAAVPQCPQKRMPAAFSPEHDEHIQVDVRPEGYRGGAAGLDPFC